MKTYHMVGEENGEGRGEERRGEERRDGTMRAEGGCVSVSRLCLWNMCQRGVGAALSGHGARFAL